MLFTNLSFWTLLTIYILVLLCIKNIKIRNLLTLFFSYLFYASFELWFCIPLLLSTLLDYYLGKKIEDNGHKKNWLYVSVVSNLSLLCFFKYTNQFYHGDSFLTTFPIGISFYTFQSMSYVIDVYRGKVKASRSFWDFSLYVAFFPQLLAGPIERAHSLLPQIQKGIRLCFDKYREAVGLILIGLFKKIVIGDKLGWIVQDAFNQNTNDPAVLVLGAVAAHFKVYADFSGYSDVARGIAKLLGVELTINFMPFYTSKNPSEFWSKWHRSLSFWVRDYLFNVIRPHGDRRLQMMVALWISFIIIGVWHGNTWNWLAFGIFHGTIMVLYHFVLKRIPRKLNFIEKLWPLGMLAIYFFCGLFYEIGTFSDFLTYMEKIAHLNLIGEMGARYLLAFSLLLAPLLLADFYWVNNEKLSRKGFGPVQGLIWGLLLFLILNSNTGDEPYVYFQF